MAILKSLAKRLLSGFRTSPRVSCEHSFVVSPYLQSCIVPRNAARNIFFSEYLTYSRSSYVDNSASVRLEDLTSIPPGTKLGEKMKRSNFLNDPACMDSLLPSSPGHIPGSSMNGVTVEEARKLLRLSQGEKLRGKLREISKTFIPVSEFLRICVESCDHEEQGAEFAKRLDETGEVIVLGNLVFLRPERVTQTIGTLLSQSLRSPEDPSREKLEELERKKAEIDEKARAQVRGELHLGLIFLLAQTAGLMRLTFWELSWDVMEPICFFLTSLQFALAYGFFLRTSTEPTFQGYFHRRFQTKQKRMMEAIDFDLQKYHELKKAFRNPDSAKSEPYPNCSCGICPLHRSFG